MELKITKEKILEAASKCKDASGVLKTIFPEAFENEEPFIRHNGNGFNTNVAVVSAKKDKFIIMIDVNEFVLSPFYEWKLKESLDPVYSDGSKEIRLVPTLKQD